jgi:hypothetical protein
VAHFTPMRACTPLHRPPPAVSTASRCQTSLCARRAPGNAYFALQSENVVKIVQTLTPPQNRKSANLRKKSAPVASLHSMHASLNFRVFSPWRGGSDAGCTRSRDPDPARYFLETTRGPEDKNSGQGTLQNTPPSPPARPPPCASQTHGHSGLLLCV